VVSVVPSLGMLSLQCSSEWSIFGTRDLWKMSELGVERICGGFLGGVCPVISKILSSRPPVKSILVLCAAAAQPVESHVHGLHCLGEDLVGE
jgi:hypothetical protein